MSLLISFNILACLSIILFLTGFDIGSIVEMYLKLSSSKLIANYTWAIVTLFIPSMGINYFFVFRKKKYEHILSNYKFKNGKLLLIYFCLSVIAMFAFSLLNK